MNFQFHEWLDVSYASPASVTFVQKVLYCIWNTLTGKSIQNYILPGFR